MAFRSDFSTCKAALLTSLSRVSLIFNPLGDILASSLGVAPETSDDYLITERLQYTSALANFLGLYALLSIARVMSLALKAFKFWPLWLRDA